MTDRYYRFSCRNAAARSLSVILGLLLPFSLTAAPILPSVQTSAQRPSGSGDEKDVRLLEPGNTVKRELAGGQQHIYRVKLNAGQFLKAVIEQEGIDVMVEVSGPDGAQLFELDSEIRLHGWEEVPLVAESMGDYRLTIQSTQKQAAAGVYEIRIGELRDATEQDRTLYEARKLKYESDQLESEGKYDQALPLAERVREIRERMLSADDPDVADALNDLAYIYSDKGEYAKAASLFQRAHLLWEKKLGPDDPAVASALNNLGVLYSSKIGDYVKAEPLYQQALAIWEKALGPGHPNVATCLDNLAVLYERRGDYAKAETLYSRALDLREKALGSDHPSVARSLNNLANHYDELGNYIKAEPLYRRALSIQEKALGPDHPDLGLYLNNLVALYDAMGDYVKAEALYSRALAIWEKTRGPDHPDVALSLSNLALLYHERGDYLKAEALNQRALAIREKALEPYHPEVALSLNNLAFLYQELGDFAKAEPLYKRALDVWEKAQGPDHPNVAIALSNLAALYREQSDYTKAEPLSKRALEIREKMLGPDHPLLAASLENLANLYRKQGDYVKADPLYWRGLAIREIALGPQHPLVAETLNNLARLSAGKGDLARAREFQARANDIGEHNLMLNLATGSERQKLAYLALFSAQTDFTLTLHSQAAPDDPQALDLAFSTLLRRKGRGLDAMTDIIALLRRHLTPDDQKLLDQLAEARSQLATLNFRESSIKPDTYQTQLKPLEDKIDSLEADLSAHSAGFRAQAKPVTLSAVQAALPPGSALIEFAVFTPRDLRTGKSKPPRYLAYVLPAQGRAKWADLGETASIDRLIDEWRKALRGRPDVKQLGRELDEKVMRPVRPLLGESRRLLIAPDGSLNLIPFAALVDEAGRYLVERYTISYLTSGRDVLKLQRSEPSQSPPLIVANPDFGRVETVTLRGINHSGNSQATYPGQTGTTPFSVQPFGPLPRSEAEALAIKELIPRASVLLGKQAAEAAIKQTHSPRILHIATHGFFLSDEGTAAAEPPGAFSEGSMRVSDLRLGKWAARIKDPLLRSGLALTGANIMKSGDDDGVLTALEAAGLDLGGTKMVVLSACETGVGEIRNGEGVQGLRRALVLAGSESQVMSLWPVTDEGAKELMIQYYRALRRGEGRSEGLRHVQLRMLRSTRWWHPFYWAAFIQSGAWASLENVGSPIP